jgi:hypothetical protein
VSYPSSGQKNPGARNQLEQVAAVCNLQSPAHADSSLADFSTLKMDAKCSSETSVHTRSTQRHIPENGILHSHRRENLKSYKYQDIRTFTEHNKIMINYLQN